MFCFNRQGKQEDGLVTERFRNHSGASHFTKVIVNPRMTIRLDIHDHLYYNNSKSRDPTGRWNVDNFLQRPPVDTVLRMNHYWTKSYEEYVRRKGRGQGDRYYTMRERWQLVRHLPNVCNDTFVNDSLVEWAIPLVKENLAKRRSSEHFPTLDRRGFAFSNNA
jgi:hypothetical protein